jgi:7 transmembrane sweet-taste receptor of 3 GCPR
MGMRGYNITLRRRIEEVVLGAGLAATDVPVKYHLLGNGVRIAGLVMMSIVIALGSFLAVWVYWNRNAQVVKMMQPPFLFMVCVGIIVSSFTIIPLGANDENTSNIDAACLALPWLASIGDTITISALSSKLLR